MSLGLLLFGGALLGSAIKCGIQNADMMSSPYKHLDDGTPVYLDRKCQQWANGEKIVPTYDYKNNKLVYAGQRSGKVYVDPEAIKRQKQEYWDEKDKESKIKFGYKSYMKYFPELNKKLTCEIGTDKIIAKLWREKVGDEYVYRKYYTDLNTIKSRMWDGNYLPIDAYKEPKAGDEGIVISREEFKALNIWDGSHSGTFFTKYRDI